MPVTTKPRQTNAAEPKLPQQLRRKGSPPRFGDKERSFSPAAAARKTTQVSHGATSGAAISWSESHPLLEEREKLKPRPHRPHRISALQVIQSSPLGPSSPPPLCHELWWRGSFKGLSSLLWDFFFVSRP